MNPTPWLIHILLSVMNGNNLIEVGELADFIEELVPAITQRKWGYEQFPMRNLSGASFAVGRRP